MNNEGRVHTCWIDDGVAALELAGPTAINAIDETMARTLRDQVRHLVNDPAVRVLVVRGQGANFSAGGDIATFATTPDLPECLATISADLAEVVEHLQYAKQPVLAIARGVVAGAGLGLLLAADLVLAHDAARFRAGHLGVALSPDAGLSWTLPRRVGSGRAMELILTNRPVDAQQALAMGLVDQVVAGDTVDHVAGQLARDLARGPRAATAAAKWLLRWSFDVDLHSQLQSEITELRTCGGHPDAREGAEAFLEKRTPLFGC